MDITGLECPSKVLIGKVSFQIFIVRSEEQEAKRLLGREISLLIVALCAELMVKFPIFIENLLLVDTMVPLSSLQIEFEFSMYFTVKILFFCHIRKLSFDMDLPLCFYLW